VTARRYAVELTQGAEDDLEAIHAWLAERRSPDDADALIDRFIEVRHP
jgi:toxin ParE1/3/4